MHAIKARLLQELAHVNTSDKTGTEQLAASSSNHCNTAARMLDDSFYVAGLEAALHLHPLLQS